ncbi:MAG TPA: glycosyltransferase family 4 protein [Bacteroidia bacterium]|nr:glycosyltransferase family 4 protein [Bacteroidia bacterium]HNT79296.1 glycosyltransferase family 4 protein [Bacteroidia bacterium]
MQKDKSLHIVSFDIPFPPDYGGVIDVFFKIRSLHSKGVKIILHSFEYNRSRSKELDLYCDKVYYYKRNVNKQLMFHHLPYIVVSRMNNVLLENLCRDQFPILFEGLHCTGHINHPHLSNRIKIVRSHNIEHVYYQNLGKAEKDLFKKYYFMNEAGKLEQHESVLQHASSIACISQDETDYYNARFGKSFLLPAFHSFNEVESKIGTGSYVLYHGNLNVAENLESALYLINEYAPKIKVPLIIAGKKPSTYLKKAVSKSVNTKLIANPDHQEMLELISHAHIHVLPGNYGSGIKLKLLNALHRGRFVITTEPMVRGSGLEETCFISTSTESMIKLTDKLLKTPFKDHHIRKRKILLSELYSNDKNGEVLLKKIYAS